MVHKLLKLDVSMDPHAMEELAIAISESGVNALGFAVSPVDGRATVLFMPDRVDDAVTALQEESLDVEEVDALLIDPPAEPEGVGEVLQTLLDRGVQVRGALMLTDGKVAFAVDDYEAASRAADAVSTVLG